ncbi:MAG: DNA primase [Eubacteriaceae bacterium]|nr:DNA primase [Eubacteriaceae bacterium]
MSRGYSEDQIQQVIDGSDIVGIISQFVTLKKAGNSYKGKCPFHSENTPSFVVSENKQLYHCFGCGVGGNVVTFIMAMENMNFVEAIKHLATRANIHLPDPSSANDAQSSLRDRQYALHRDAALYYHKSLIKHVHAQQYLYKRGIEEQTIKQFALGYSSNETDGLYRYLVSKKFTAKEMTDSGLVMESGRGVGYYDRFRNRIMFPIVTITGKVIGFGGRLLEKDSKYPKYLNSPENPVFTKGRHLYALNEAKKHIENGQLIIVEGYMDVISLHQRGIRNVVASLGTALTRNQGTLIKRYVDEVVMSYDGDAAGKKAMLRGIEVLDEIELGVKILRLPDGLDPDDYVKKFGPDEFRKVLAASLATVDYKIQSIAERYDLQKTDQKIKFIKEAAAVLASVKNDIEKEIYIKKFAAEMGIDAGHFIKDIKAGGEAEKQPESKSVPHPQGMKINVKKNARELAQEIVLNIMLYNVEKGEKIIRELSVENFSQGIYKLTAEFIYNCINEGKEPNISGFMASLDSEDDVRLISSFLLVPEEYEDKNIEEYLNRLKVFNIKDEISILQEKINDYNLNEEKLNDIYCRIVEKKREIERIQKIGKEDY